MKSKLRAELKRQRSRVRHLDRLRRRLVYGAELEVRELRERQRDVANEGFHRDLDNCRKSD